MLEKQPVLRLSISIVLPVQELPKNFILIFVIGWMIVKQVSQCNMSLNLGTDFWSYIFSIFGIYAITSVAVLGSQMKRLHNLIIGKINSATKGTEGLCKA